MLSMRKVGIDFRDIRMAVLCQRVVPAAYAFVIHTTNPSNGVAERPSPVAVQAGCLPVLRLWGRPVVGLLPDQVVAFWP
jgi:alpha-glucan, water dikinase